MKAWRQWPLGRKRRTLFNDKTKERTGLRAAFSCAAQPVRDGKRDTFAPDLSFAERLGHEVIVADARKARLIGEIRQENDRLDAQSWRDRPASILR